jgi:signal transduction histidine kinase
MIFKSLQFKLSILFILLLIITSIGYFFTATQSTSMYLAEATQKLHENLATKIAREIDINTKTNAIDQVQVQRVFDQAKRYNPTIGLYLVDMTGKIIMHPSDCSATEMTVSTKEIEAFLRKDKPFPLYGDDPANPDEQRIFSAHLLKTGAETPLAYLYITLGCANATNTQEMIRQSYALKVLVISVMLALLASLIVGLVLIALLTKDLWRFVHFIHDLQNSDFSKPKRLKLSSSSELNELANAFNQMAEKIERSVAQLRDNEKLLKEFIANISHDLRTPLASIEGYMETILLKKHLLSEKEKNAYFNTILKNTRTLNHLVLQLLDLSKLEAKQVKLHMEPFSVTELLQDILLKFNPQAESSGISLDAHFPDNPSFVFADLALIDRVLQNLIGNAFQHTNTGGTVDVLVEQTDKYHLMIHVRDTGKGIPPEELANIFTRFYQGDKVRAKADSSAGLGLTIAQKILELHHSSLDVQSEVGKGTTFSFTLQAYMQSANCNKLVNEPLLSEQT